jgi:prepilin-type processing-associated H-X9-DG protein/prepilin-type N-terminal cleavage/methylation domain-containing protein
MLFFHHNRQRAFTLIELLVIVAIIGILMAIGVPSLDKARRNALQMNCASNLRQIGMAVKMYLMDHPNGFTPAVDADKYGVIASYYAPYLNEALSVFRCPAQKNDLPSIPMYGAGLYISGQNNSNAWVSYEFNKFFIYGTNSYLRTLTPRDITDATICAYAYDYPFDPTKPNDVPYFPHRGGMNVLYCDWHVSWLAIEDYGMEKPYSEQFFGKGHL